MKQKEKEKIIKKTIVGGILGATMGYLSTSKSNPKSGTMTKDRLENMKSLTSQLLNQQSQSKKSKSSLFSTFTKNKATKRKGSLWDKFKKDHKGDRKDKKSMKKNEN
ncbi:hypothetical protein [Staphylococcus hyicus]|uniref:hypothetical protein n=1 Tax=Staphylococcus hyicus TaxID=1284 RepID=UPI0036D333A4